MPAERLGQYRPHPAQRKEDLRLRKAPRRTSELAVSEQVLREEKDGLVTLTLNRPQKLNALNHAVFKELAAHLDWIEKNAANVGCVILRGAGRSFCAGHDLDDISGGGEGLSVSHFETRTIERMSDLPMPIVCVVQGH